MKDPVESQIYTLRGMAALKALETYTFNIQIFEALGRGSVPQAPGFTTVTRHVGITANRGEFHFGGGTLSLHLVKQEFGCRVGPVALGLRT